jgi:hypothetical protein
MTWRNFQLSSAPLAIYAFFGVDPKLRLLGALGLDRSTLVGRLPFADESGHFAVLCRARKMAGAAAVKENMKHDLIECRILRMSVTFPIGNMHVPLDIPFVRSIPINPNGSMHKIGAGLPIPKSELNDFNKSSGGRSKSGSERSGIPKRLPLHSIS